jgi:hypothetical protein
MKNRLKVVKRTKNLTVNASADKTPDPVKRFAKKIIPANNPPARIE